MIRNRSIWGFPIASKPLLQQLARSQTRPWYQVQQARIVLAIAAGERIQSVASQLQCDPSTIWRVCRRYEQAGMAAVVERTQRAGCPLRISPSATGANCAAGLSRAGGERVAYHPLVEPGPGVAGNRRWDGAGYQWCDASPYSA